MKSSYKLFGPDMAKLSSKDSSEDQSLMALPSLSKRGYDEALWFGLGWGTPLFSSFMILVPAASTSSAPRPPPCPVPTKMKKILMLLVNEMSHQFGLQIHQPISIVASQKPQQPNSSSDVQICNGRVAVKALQVIRVGVTLARIAEIL